MKKTLLLLLLTGFLNLSASAQTVTTKIFDKVTFYDGYAKLTTEPVPAGVTRFRNDLYSVKLTEAQLNSFGSTLTANVIVTADCDDYDRIGYVNLALVPKGATTYVPANVKRIELGRYITPFMDKNYKPTVVPYSFNIDNIAKIFKDPVLNNEYDFWIELQLFGVPYAARTEVAGCTGRSDVFYGTLELVSNTTALTSKDNFLLPIDFQHSFNNYQAANTDAVGTTVRTYNFDLPAAVLSPKFYLMISNHGAGTNGEEYVQRVHHCTFDNYPIFTFTPGETSCEPYRVYNTMGNHVYNTGTQTDAYWARRNWCPGAVIPTRIIPLDYISAGSHSFKISVPDAVFYGKAGDFPISLYLQGTGRTVFLGSDDINLVSYSLYPNPSKDIFNIDASQEIKSVKVYNMLGQQVWQGTGNQIDLSQAEHGVYTASILFDNDKLVSEKIIKN